MTRHADKRGFTLVEMMIVIALLAIIAAIAAPNFQTYMAQRRLNGAARQVMTDLMDARMKAVSENNQFKVFFLDTHQYKVLDDENNNGTEDTGETSVTKDIQSDYPGVTLSASAHPIFYPRGTAWGTTVTLTNTSGSKSVSVSTAGRVKIQ